MSDDAIGRTVGQAYFDLAMREPSALLGTAAQVGRAVREEVLDGAGGWSTRWGDVVEQYLKDSLVAHSPTSAVVALLRMAAVKACVDGAGRAA